MGFPLLSPEGVQIIIRRFPPFGFELNKRLLLQSWGSTRMTAILSATDISNWLQSRPNPLNPRNSRRPRHKSVHNAGG